MLTEDEDFKAVIDLLILNPPPSLVSTGFATDCKNTERSNSSAKTDQLGSCEHPPFLSGKSHEELSLIGLSFYLCPGPLSIRRHVWI